ncbi:MAG: hypothetical protein A2X58_14755 [Nitrospirae bacterium GWC2_56_14]|nr:MAG: hypothetical protein A2X83_00425 [Desulfuromonadales bacterium GWD2_54_10]OGW39740.1 MAG: hypothetical protein A2X58_14755 [Nitrospirae bacterium GWC2_56_14]
MAAHALNLANPGNYIEKTVILAGGTHGTARLYASPPDEEQHFAALQRSAQDNFADINMQTSLPVALEDPSRSSQDFAAKAVEWAQASVPEAGREDDALTREQGIISAALIAMRDGAAELRSRHEGWAREIFLQALKATKDPYRHYPPGLSYNPIATAFAGMVYLMQYHPANGDVRDLLDSAASGDPNAACGFGAVVATLASIDVRLPRSILRCALAGCIHPARTWDLPEEEVTARSERHLQRIRAAVDAELAWLGNEEPEPGWPMFPTEEVQRRRQLRIPGGEDRQDAAAARRVRPDEVAYHQSAAKWLHGAKSLFNIAEQPWLSDIARAYGPWTAAANGAGIDANEDISHTPMEWSDAYFELLAYCLPGLSLTEIDEFALSLVSSLPDMSFYDVVTKFLSSVDAVFFNQCSLQEVVAVNIRDSIADRMMTSHGWRRLAGSRDTSVEMHLGPAVATLFFNERGFSQPPRCYLLEIAIDRVEPFLPILKKLAISGPSIFTALLTLNLLEVSPRSAHLPFVVETAKSWLVSFPDYSVFWGDHDIGRRLCVWFENVWRLDPTQLGADSPIRFDVDRLLAALVSLGIPEARRLEDTIETAATDPDRTT